MVLRNEPESESKDCLSCRLVTGFCVVGIGVYIYAQAKRRRKIEMYAMRTLAAGVFGIGVARLLNMDFLKSKK